MATKKDEVKSQFDTWLETQSEDVKELVNQRFEALTHTVKATREERDTLAQELKGLAKKIDENSDAGKQLGDLNARLAAAEKKATFLELATKQGVKRPTAAFAIANSENLYTEDGQPDWEKIKESVPELFTAQPTNSNAGSGTDKKPQGDFNASIRNHLNQKHRKIN